MCVRVTSCTGTMIADRAEDTLKEIKPYPQPMTPISIETEAPNVSLSSRLSEYRKDSGNRRPDFVRAYDELVARLNVIDRGQVGPRLGELMPRFDLPDHNGRLIALADGENWRHFASHFFCARMWAV